MIFMQAEYNLNYFDELLVILCVYGTTSSSHLYNFSNYEYMIQNCYNKIFRLLTCRFQMLLYLFYVNKIIKT